LNELSRISGADLIYFNILLKDTTRKYEMASLPIGSSKENVVFYNADKVSLKESKSIRSTPRTIDHYNFYYNPAMNAVDTVFFNLFACHLKAGSTSAKTRYNSIKLLKEYIVEHPSLKNKIVAGDFNMYGSN